MSIRTVFGKRRSLALLASVVALVAAPVIYFTGHAHAATSNIFGTTTPTVATSSDGQGVELGVKFTSDVPGQVTGIRFYKGSTANGGTHMGHLWSTTGTQLAQAKFVSETNSGWQTVSFSSPVSISANTTYIASYYAPKGHYSYTSNGLASAVNAPPLHALANTSTSPDGIYKYSTNSAGAFPSNGFNSTNYYVDVNFTPATSDTTAPTVNITNPANNSSVSGTVNLTATATDNVAVASVQYFLDGNTLSGAVTTSPYNYSWSTTAVANGTHTLTAKATDTSGNVGTSSSVTVTVSNTDTVAPTATITAPANNASVSGTIQLQSSASDNVAVSSVQYQLDGNILSTPLMISPYTYSFDTTSVANGTHTLVAQATDTSGNVGSSAPVTINVQNSAPTPPPTNLSTIWPATATPAHADSGDPGAGELGVKFTSSANGYITGMRFYKGGTSNGGTHIGQLWSSTGSLLAQATFTNESSSGWQNVTFSPSVQITAGTTYIAGYFAPQGHYSYDAATDPGGMANSVNNPPLSAPSSGSSGGNDVYVYSSSPAFPNQTYNSNNYWVDVYFSTSNTAPDTVAPSVSIATPANNATVAGAVALTANASYNVAVATVQYLVDGNVVGSALTSNPYTFNWDSTTVSNGTHTITAKATDTSGNATTSAPVTLTVQNTIQARPGVRGSGPLLVLTDPTNPFTDDYCSALLKTEGLPECAATDTGNLTGSFDLSPYRTIILAGGSPLTGAQVTQITNWVSAGGTFIAMRPNDNLDSLLGIGANSGTLSDRYYKVNPAQLPGIETQTMQYHGAADQHALAGASAMATLYSDANTATAFPAVTSNVVGSGKAVAYMFDVSQAVSLLRNGNPALAGQVTVSASFDGLPRFTDRFGNGWLDTSKAGIPQADELQRSLANIVESSATLPRLWYFPAVNGNTIKAALVLTGDDHNQGQSQTLNRFAAETAASPAGCSATTWTCYTSTSYAYPGAFSDAAAKPYTDAGFEVSMHAADGGSCPSNWSTQAQLDALVSTDISNWQNSYPTISAAYPMLTERFHCYGIWRDYAGIPQDEASHGIKADANTPCWPNAFLNVAQCYFTGAGIPEQYTDASGNLTGVYQFTTQATDENPSTVTTAAINGLVTNATGSSAYYGYFTLLCHLDNLAISNSCAASALQVAQSNNVPMISARLAELFWDGRNNASVTGVTYGTGSLTFSVSAPVANLQVMVPVAYNGKTLSGVTVGGNSATYTTQTINGISYAFVTIPQGSSNLAASYQ